MFRIAIQPDDQLLTSGRSQSFSSRWVEALRELGHEPCLVDATSPDFLDRVRTCDGFMWWYAHLPFPRHLARRLVPAVEHGLSLPVFPDWKTAWHFDDKIAQIYLLQAAGIPTARTWIFWNPEEATRFCRSASYPLVLKLASGIVSENVRLVRDSGEAEHWIGRMFGPGLAALNRPPVRTLPQAARRARQIARRLLKGTPPGLGRTDLQRGYLLVQEFLPGNDFDIRVAVIGDRAFAFKRLNRPNDFRASGSGLREHDPSAIHPEAVRLAFRTARKLEAQSLAVDVLRRPGGGRVLVEISYYYEGWLLHMCPGRWELRGDPERGRIDWVEGRMPPEDAILQDFLARVGERKGLPAGAPVAPAAAAI